MTTLRAEINGKVVWKEEVDVYRGGKDFGQYLARPADTPAGEPHPDPVYLYVDDTLVGIQRSHGDEAEQLHIQAAWWYAGGQIDLAVVSRLDADTARIKYLEEVGDVTGAAEARQARIDELVSLLDIHEDAVFGAIASRDEPGLLKAMFAAAKGKG